MAQQWIHCCAKQVLASSMDKSESRGNYTTFVSNWIKEFGEF